MLDRITGLLQNAIKYFQDFLENLTSKAKLRIFKATLAVLLLSISTYFLAFQYFDQPINVQVGDIADFDIRVPHDIDFIQPAETQRAQERARKQILEVYDRDQSILNQGQEQIKILFDNIDIVNKERSVGENFPINHFVNELKRKLPDYFPISYNTLRILLVYNGPYILRQRTENLFVSIMDQPILEQKQNEANGDINITIRTINSSEEIPDLTKGLKDIEDIENIRKKIYKFAREKIPTLTRRMLQAVVETAGAFIKPNLYYNEAETFRRKELGAKNTKPVKGKLRKGHIIVRYGELITRAKFDKIEIINKYRSKINISKILGLLLIQLVLAALFIGFFYRYTTVKFKNAKNIMMMALINFLMIVIIFMWSRVDGIFRWDSIFAVYIPITFLTLTLSILFDEKVAIGCGIFMSLYIFLISNNEDYASLYTALVTALLGSFSVSRVKKRADFLKIGFYIGLSKVLIILMMALYKGLGITAVAKLSLWGVLISIGSSILVFGLIPVLESLFDITTDFKLLELTDLNTPLLKMMLFRAPGTYQHSIAVASLAESACQEIGANSLLAKVGIYYHDIGKTKRPELFIENQQPGSLNPHNALSPHESSKLIIEHVKYGLELVENNHLPKVFKEFITGHHGRTVIKYFYHKALEVEDNPEKINKENFIYPGPNPKTKETGIAMLADSIEAASRVMDKPITVQKIRDLVKKIISNKISEGLLDECDLTLSDLRKVGDTFESTLTGIFHSRIKYPKDTETQNLETKLLKDSGEDNNNQPGKVRSGKIRSGKIRPGKARVINKARNSVKNPPLRNGKRRK